MQAPALTDRLVKVFAYLTDETYGYEHWRAAQFSAPDVDGRWAVLITYPTRAARDAGYEALAQLEALP